eukprot:681146-Rhodomonas_salina.1
MRLEPPWCTGLLAPEGTAPSQHRLPACLTPAPAPTQAQAQAQAQARTQTLPPSLCAPSALPLPPTQHRSSLDPDRLLRSTHTATHQHTALTVMPRRAQGGRAPFSESHVNLEPGPAVSVPDFRTVHAQGRVERCHLADIAECDVFELSCLETPVHQGQSRSSTARRRGQPQLSTAIH